MSLSQLLNPEGENPVAAVPSAEEWFNEMQEKELEEQEKRNVVEDLIPPPTNAAALEAASLLIQYIESTDTPEGTAADHYLHSLERMLVKEVHFGNKKQSSIIDFSSKNAK
ncbi:hypothetical protein DFH28DRAFT_1121305 [Melampsora americana]|nr:hypothetical protein DFH28DRAFT_1121305 [Melampsora americana]